MEEKYLPTCLCSTWSKLWRDERKGGVERKRGANQVKLNGMQYSQMRMPSGKVTKSKVLLVRGSADSC